jgi:putative iron-only hydrogenase system regulator
MEKRIGTVSILISDTHIVPEVNRLLSDNGSIIIARQGVPLHQYGINIITLIIEATTDQLSSLTGKLGRLPDVEVKSILAKKQLNN